MSGLLDDGTDWAALSPVPAAAGHLLVATPVLDQPPFRRSVVHLVEHNDEGTLGVVVNRPTGTRVAEVLPQWGDLVAAPDVVFEGGPVQRDGALCLGGADGVSVVDLDADASPLRGTPLRVFVGYAGWSPGQLDEELAERAWWTVPGTPDDVFGAEPWDLWAAVLRRQQPPLALFATYPDDPNDN